MASWAAADEGSSTDTCADEGFAFFGLGCPRAAYTLCQCYTQSRVDDAGWQLAYFSHVFEQYASQYVFGDFVFQYFHSSPTSFPSFSQ